MSKIAEAAEEFVEKMTDIEPPMDQEQEQEQAQEAAAAAEGSGKMTMQERKAKMDELRRKMVRVPTLPSTVQQPGWRRISPARPQRASALENRRDVAEESTKAKVTAREAARLERQRKLAETLRLKADAEERGEDVERAKNWEYTIEENDEWERKLARKARRADFEFHSEWSPFVGCRWCLAGLIGVACWVWIDDADAARKKYKKDLDFIKPNLEAYNRQKEIALGLAPGTLAKTGSSSAGTSSTMTTFDPSASSVRILTH
jgi:pre-mRNA-splicing factor SYF2